MTFHLKSETSKWKKSPYFGSVDGDETHQYFKGDSSMESVQKEAKNGFACQKMSSTNFQANEVKLQICMLAYNFNNWFRRLCLPENMQPSRMETIRTQLVKIAGKLVRSGRYWTWKLCSSCVYKTAFKQTLENIGRIPRLE